MHATRFPIPFRSGIDFAPPATPTVFSSCSFGSIAKPLPFTSSLRFSASKRSEVTPTEFQTHAAGESAQASSSAPAWGAALASKARKANAAAGLRQQHQQQEQTLETVEAVAVAPNGSAFGVRGSAAANDGPVVVVQPQEPSQRPPPPPFSSSLPSSRSPTAAGRRGAPAVAAAAPPPVTFVRPPGRPRGRSTTAGADPSPPRTGRAAAGADSSSGTSSSGSGGSGSIASYDPFSKMRVHPRAGAASPAVPPWLNATTAAKRAGARSASTTPPPPPRFATTLPPLPHSAATSDAKSTPRSANAAAVDAAAAAAATAPASQVAPVRTSSRSGGDGGNLTLSVSFSQVMGRQKRSKGQENQDPDTVESNVVDYTWEPDPELDVVEADAAAAEEERQRRREMQRDVARERRELREAAETAVQRSYAPGAPPPPPFVGSVKAERIPGRGFGLVADEDVAAGQLLLVALPAVSSRGAPGELPKMRPLLTEALRLLRLADGIPPPSSSSMSSSAAVTAAAAAAAATADGRALASLFWGAPRPSSVRPPVDLAGWRVRQQELLSPPVAAAAKRGGGGDGGAATAGAGKSGMTWTQPRVMSLLQLNLVAEGTQDSAAAVARSEPLTSLMGVWPEVALVNHSCAPNAVAVMLYDRLVVRATRRIPRGREVLLNWLGATGALAPLKERRSQLSQMYTFTCRCARCLLEGSEAVSLPFLYSDAERGSEEALEAIERALQVRDLRLLTLALQPLQEAVAQLASAVQLLGEQVDLTGGREGMLMAAAAADDGDGADGGSEEKDDGGSGSVSGGADGGLAAVATATQRVKMAPTRKTPAAAGRAAKSRGGTAAGELGPLDRVTAEAWLLGGMLPLHEALVEALAYRAAWLGMDIGPGWHWPPEQPIAVPASAAAATGSAVVAATATATQQQEGAVVVVVEDSELEEQQAEVMAELIGSLVSYVDVVAQLLPGSETHTQAAARLLTLNRRYLGPMDRVAGEISTAVYDAHVLRYGKLDEDTFERLLAAGMEALDAARRREADQRQAAAAETAVVGGDGGDDDGVVEGEAEDLEELFFEDQRLREAHAAETASAAAAAATQAPRSWPLRRGRQAAAAAAPVEHEQEEEEELPEGVAVARPARGDSTTVGSSGGSRRHAVMEEAKQDLMRILGSASPSASSGASPRTQKSVAAAAAAAATKPGRNEEDDDDGHDGAAAVRRLLRRDAVPGAGPSVDGYDNGANNATDADANDAGGKAPGGKEAKWSPQQKFESSLDRLLNVFPGLSAAVSTDYADGDDCDDDATNAATAKTVRRPRR